MEYLIFYSILTFNLISVCQMTKNNNNNNVAYNIPDPDCTGVFYLCTDADKERLGRRAIQAIHEQMDDDKDGLIEASESRDFIHEELQSKTDSIRHKRFQNADLRITFDDLWTQWKNNPVYNWSNDDVIHWLVHNVHLSIYVEYFRRNQIDGRMIPRLAANEKQYLSTIMQIRDPRHKRLMIIKATDVVLFGPPHRTHSYIKDMVLISALVVSVVACLYALIRHRKTQDSMKLMMKELETLQQAEGDLIAVTGKMRAMENELQDKAKVDRGLLNSWFNEIQQTKEEAEKYRKRRGTTVENDKQLRLAVQEIEQLRIALRKAEEHARHQAYEPPTELLDLLKHTYHIEEVAFELKRKAAENAMLAAKDQMNKITKMQRGFFGAVRIAHTGCMDNIGELINAAKEKLAEIHDEYEERERRWERIASLLDRSDLLSQSMPTNELINRSKPLNIETNNLLSANNESSIINRTNSNLNIRGISTTSVFPTQISQQDNTSQSDSGVENSNSPSAILRRRAIQNSRFINNSSIIHSNSTNDLRESNFNSNIRQHVYDSTDTMLLTKQNKALFEGIPDQSSDNDEITVDDQQQQQQQQQQSAENKLSENSSKNVRQRSTSPAKARKQNISTKIFRPFHNLRLRKKSPPT